MQVANTVPIGGNRQIAAEIIPFSVFIHEDDSARAETSGFQAAGDPLPAFEVGLGKEVVYAHDPAKYKDHMGSRREARPWSFPA